MERLKQVWLVILVCLSIQVVAQETNIYNPWKEISEQYLKEKNLDRLRIPKSYAAFKLDQVQLSKALKEAPPRFSEFAKQQQVILSLPMPDGSIQRFSIVDAPVMHPQLRAQFPEIHAYAGQGLDDPTAFVRFNTTPSGFFAMILSANHETVFIDPYASNDKEYHISYYKKDFSKKDAKAFVCHFDEVNDIENLPAFDATTKAGDCMLRTYRLALACTGEYAQFHGGTINSVMAAFVTSMTRVNGIFEREAAITMVLVPNNDDLIFLDGSTDPYTNNSGGAMLSQNQTTIDNIIGSTNYDIGHVFSTGGGGVAFLDSPCGGSKAGGVTGLGAPIGDPFDVDYVAHEMGHQYGGTHTQNNDCNRTNRTAVEPGSASTIMGYAGICAPNVQNNSDDYFHAASIDQMAIFSNNSSCPEVTNTGNDAPSVDAGADYIIPASTSFELTAIGTDPNFGNTLTYCWEQMDTEAADMPPVPTNVGGPLFRSFDPTTSPSRYFPSIFDIVGNNTPTWEVLPSVSRAMNFRCTVRDNFMGAGCTDEDDVVITVDGNSGPFEVIAPNTNVTWFVGNQETVSWDVANTNQAPINASMVDIFLSLDGGFTYPITLASAIPNTGTATITVPNLIGTDNRVRVQGHNNVFFDISNTEFAIEEPPTPTFLLNLMQNDLVVCKDEGTVSFEFTINPLAGFNESVTFDATGIPVGATYSFSTNPVVPSGNTVTLTINDLQNTIEGNYPISITGTSTSQIVSTNVTLNVLGGIPTITTLNSPSDGKLAVSINPELNWMMVNDATSYVVEVATSPTFDSSIFFNQTVNTNSANVSGLTGGTVYYWRVKSVNPCDESEFVGGAFQTEVSSCQTYSLGGLPQNLNDGAGTGLSFSINDSGLMTDVNVEFQVNHTWVGDLSAILTSPQGTSINLFDRTGLPDLDANYGCDQDNLNIFFDDEATNTYDDLESTCELNMPYAIEGTFQPLDMLSSFNGENGMGEWQLVIFDAIPPDAGTLEVFNLEICNGNATTPPSLLNNETLTVLESETKAITTTLLSSTSMGSMPNEIVYTVLSNPQFGTLFLNGVTLSIGDIFTQADIDNNLISYTHNGTMTMSDSFDFHVTDANAGWLPNNTFNIIIEILVNDLEIVATLDNDISCNNANDGQISVSVNGGTAPLEYSLDGMNFQMSNTFTGLSEGSYNITVRDANNFTIMSTAIQVNNPTVLSANSSVNMDDVTVNASGGTGALMYSLDGMNFQSSNVFSDLANGMYTITIQDENNCTTTTMATVAVNTLLVQASGTNISCFGANDGTLTVIASGGTMPLEYSIDGGMTYQSSNIFAGLFAGTYNPIVKDAENFTMTANTITISEPVVLIASSSVEMDVVTVNASGGTGNLMYSIDGINFQMSNVFGSLANGMYTITVQDENNCTMTTMATVAVNTLVVSASTVNEINCNGDANGSITVSVSGGAMPYQYSINNGASYQTSNIFSDLSAGTYTILVLDNEDFTRATNAITLNNPTALTISANVTIDEITANGTGGTGNLMYSIDGTNYQNSPIFTGLANGSYTVYVQDANGCISTTTAIVAVNSLVVSATVTNDISCNDANDGLITINVAGGMMPYEYSLNGVNFQSSNTFANLSAGMYTIIVKDAQGFNMMTNNVTITNPTAIIASSSVDMNVVTITASGGTGTLMYSLDGMNFQNSNVFGNVANGTYTITIMDENGCTSTTMATISVNTLAVQASGGGISCFGSSDGTLTVFVLGGTMPYEYSIDGGISYQSGDIFTGLSAGIYTATVLDAEGFTMMTNAVTISEPTAITAFSSVNMNELTVTASGGTGNLTYSIDGMNFQISNVFSNLLNGNYTVTIQDENGCTSTTMATISVNTLAVQASGGEISCFGSSDGTLTVFVSGGMMPYEYSIDGGMSYQSGDTFVGLSAGTYTGTVRDAEGFTMMTNAVSITEPTALSASSSVNMNEITINASGGTGNLTYSIDGMNFQNSNVFSNLLNGNYTITIQDENGCTTTTIATVSVNTLSVQASGGGVSCFGLSDGSLMVFVSGGMMPYEYSIDGGMTYQSNNEFTGLAAGTYTATVRDAEGFTIVTNVVSITEPTALSASSSVNMNEITITASGGTGNLMYSIDGMNFQNSNVFFNLPNGDYTITIQDENSCITTIMATVSVNTLDVQSVTSNISCFGEMDGTLTVFASGGMMPYEYSIDGGMSYQSSNEFTGLAAGIYTAIVRDAEGFTIMTTPLTIVEPNLLTASAGVDMNEITVTSSGGTGSLMYSIDGTNFQVDNVFSNLPNGEYTITVQDENGCISTTTAIVNVIDPLVIVSTTFENISCHDADDGTITVTVEGGIAPYEYSLNGIDFQISNVFSNLTAGDYEIDIRDANGSIISTNTITITNPDPIDFSVTIAENDITIDATGGTGVYQYSIDGGNTYQDSNVFMDLAIDTYNVVVRDENGCLELKQVLIQGTSIDELAFQIQFTIHPNPSNGIFTLTLDQPTNKELQVQIFDAVGKLMLQRKITKDGSYLQTILDCQHLSAGSYQLLVTDGELKGLKQLIIIQ